MSFISTILSSKMFPGFTGIDMNVSFIVDHSAALNYSLYFSEDCEFLSKKNHPARARASNTVGYIQEFVRDTTESHNTDSKQTFISSYSSSGVRYKYEYSFFPSMSEFYSQLNQLGTACE